MPALNYIIEAFIADFNYTLCNISYTVTYIILSR